MAVRIRMKKMGRAHRPFFRICAIDKRSPRDGRVLEELGTYDPSVADTDARAQLDNERVDYWLSVGAQPSDKVAVLIKKYGSAGTHVAQQEAALEQLAAPKTVPAPGEPASLPKTPEEPKPAAEEPTAKTPAAVAESADESGAATEEKPAEDAAETKEEPAPVEEKTAAEEATAES